MKARSLVTTAVVVSAIVCAIQILSAAIDVKTSAEKTFDFKTVKTWGWATHDRGKVIMSRTQQDDAEAARARAEPIIMDAVKTEMSRRGLTAAASAPDLALMYYLLLSTNTSSQSLGDFLPATTMWGLPPFAPATQSMELMNKGSLVLDAVAGDKVVWRGLAEAKIQMDADDKKRETLLREAVRDLVRKFPSGK